MSDIWLTERSATEVLRELAAEAQSPLPLPPSVYAQRQQRAQQLMQQQGLSAIYLHPGSNLRYFVGHPWGGSERLFGVILPAQGEWFYIAPAFERASLLDFALLEAEVVGWQEHQNPYRVLLDALKARGLQAGPIGLDESTPFFISDGLAACEPQWHFCSAQPVTAGCRMYKSAAEIALIKQAMQLTLKVQRAAASILRPGIDSAEVAAFLDQAHLALGAPKGAYFAIVLFGEASAYPHGVSGTQRLARGDTVLIDTGCDWAGYKSDITRTYVYGEPSARQRQLWEAEKRAQLAVFEAAQLGVRCGDLDRVARASLAQDGFGPEYQTPGLVHRTGHGIGLDIHEWPYLNWADETPLGVGMCLSNEPMISAPGEFGVRLEDHFYMTDHGAKWFTQPSPSLDQPW